MTRIRRNIYDLGSDWAEPILWYVRAVKAMKSRDLDENTSWLFYSGIYGYNCGLWDFHRLIPAGQSEPSQAVQDKFWNQCQHGTWYFLPWHRGYGLALEAVLLNRIKAQNGSYDTWAMPYWNYFKTGQNDLPPAFASPDWPDGQGGPLFVQARFGPFNDGHVFVPLNVVAMAIAALWNWSKRLEPARGWGWDWRWPRRAVRALQYRLSRFRAGPVALL